MDDCRGRSFKAPAVGQSELILVKVVADFGTPCACLPIGAGDSHYLDRLPVAKDAE